jgi:hypothetical protein
MIMLMAPVPLLETPKCRSTYEVLYIQILSNCLASENRSDAADIKPSASAEQAGLG